MRPLQDPPRFLIVKLAALGDLSFAYPAAQALKKVFPEATVDWIVGQKLSPFLERSPYLDSVLTVDETAFFGARPAAVLTETLALRKKLHKRYDAIFLLHRKGLFVPWLLTMTRGPIFGLSRSRMAGHTPEGHFRVRWVGVPPMSLHESLAHRKVIEEGMRAFGYSQSLSWEWDDLSHLELSDELRKELPDSYGVVHIGGGSNAKTEFRLKQWPYFQNWLKQQAELSNRHWVIVGSSGEQVELPKHAYLHDWVGRTSISDLVGVIRRAQVFVGVDSGPLHIADALKVPCVGLFGPTSEVSWGLLNSNARILRTNPDCSPCYKDDGHFSECAFEHRCMKEIQPDELTQTLKEML